MVILLIGLIILLCGLAYGFFQQKQRAQLSPSHHSTGQRTFDGLFAEQLAEESRQLASQVAQAHAEAERDALLARARGGDKSALAAAAAYGNADFYQRTLHALLDAARGGANQLAALADYIIDSKKLRANTRLAESLMDCEPNARSFARLLYIAALSDDEEVYRRAAQTALRGWRETQIGAAELRALLESSYWLLAPEIRTANFSLQQLMADLRRALAATHAPSTQIRAQ